MSSAAATPPATPPSGGLLSSIFAGTLVGFLLVIDAVSVAALIFSGPLASHVGSGVALCLLSLAGLVLVATIRSPHPASIPALQDTSSILQALLVGSVASAVAASAQPESLLPTVGAALALSTIATGVGLLVLGRLRLGHVIRFLPHPVLGGFLAGTGWLIVVWTLPILTGSPLTSGTVGELFHSDVFFRWIWAAVLAVFLVVAQRRSSHPMVTPALLLGAILCFCAYYLAMGLTLEEARAGGHLLGGPAEQGALRPLWSLGPIHYPALFSQIPTFGVLTLVTAISILLNATAVEHALDADLDMDEELRVAGESNLLAGIAGGAIGFVGVSVSTLAHRAGARTRAAGVAALVVIGGALALGSAVAGFLPTQVAGGLLLSLGLAFLVEWLYDGWYRLPVVDWVLVILILTAIAIWGFFAGMGLGLVVATGIFVVNYAGINVVRSVSSGRTARSNVERAPRQQAILKREGEQIQVIHLQGYLFFGVARTLQDTLAEISRNREPPRDVVLDFRDVFGMDSSAILALQKVVGRLNSGGAVVVFSALRVRFARALALGGFSVNDRVRTRAFPDLDRALEWCEKRTLEGHNQESAARIRLTLDQCIVPLGLQLKLHERWHRVDLEPGEYLCREGDPPNALYFLVAGRLLSWRQSPSGPRRVAVLQGSPSETEIGAIAGELGWCQGTVRSTNLTAETHAVVYTLSTQDLDRIRTEDPQMLLDLQRVVMRVLAIRLTDANQEIEGLLG